MPIRISKDEIRAVYRQGEDAVIQLVESLVDRINSLELRIEKLESQLNKNSHNSSKSPSSDIVRIPKSLRKKGKKKSGGQPGHTGYTLQQVDHPDRTIIHLIEGI